MNKQQQVARIQAGIRQAQHALDLARTIQLKKTATASLRKVGGIPGEHPLTEQSGNTAAAVSNDLAFGNQAVTSAPGRDTVDFHANPVGKPQSEIPGAHPVNATPLPPPATMALKSKQAVLAKEVRRGSFWLHHPTRGETVTDMKGLLDLKKAGYSVVVQSLEAHRRVL